ncbi:MAG: helix-turn-helix transcriptional regulator [Enterocloster asparagiformis]|nr:helix-turn-helix transcriptional regulator [Enterocloster asparagiformis]
MENTDYIIIGDRIRAARKALNLTQEEAAERCDITSSYYGNIERGTKKMSLATLMKVSKGLGISTDLLLRDTVKNQDVLIELLMNIQQNADDEQFEKYLMLIKTLSTVIDKL